MVLGAKTIQNQQGIGFFIEMVLKTLQFFKQAPMSLKVETVKWFSGSPDALQSSSSHGSHLTF